METDSDMAQLRSAAAASDEGQFENLVAHRRRDGRRGESSISKDG